MFLSRSINKAKAELDKIKHCKLDKRTTNKEEKVVDLTLTTTCLPDTDELSRIMISGSHSTRSGETARTKTSDNPLPREISTSMKKKATPSSKRTTTASTTSSLAPNIYRMKMLQYRTTCLLLESWELVRASIGTEWEYVIGTRTLLRLFEIEPRTKTSFGFGQHDVVTEDTLLESSSTKTHVALLAVMFDSMLSMLGPCCESVNELMHDLAVRHTHRGIKAMFVPFMGRAFLHCVAEALGENWNECYANAWETFMDEVSQSFMVVLVTKQL